MTTLARDIAEQIASSPDGFASAMDRVRHWTREGLLNLIGDPSPGRGRKRYYDEKALTFARVLNAMANAGFDVSKFKTVTTDNAIGNILDTVWMIRGHIAKEENCRYYITIHYGPKYGLKGEAIMEMPSGSLRDRAWIGDETEMAIVLNLSAILK